MQQMSLARLLVSVAALGVTLAAVETARGTVIASPDEVVQLAGRNVAIWRPSGSAGPHPLVLFSHGAGGCNIQSTYLMRALAEEGILVAAPDHLDKSAKCPAHKPEGSDLPADLLQVGKWGPTFHDDRGADLQRLRDALEKDADYSGLIDTTRVALVGHSLGGYTVLALAGVWPGVWPTWKMDGISAVVALAPFSQPFKRGGDGSGIKVPALFQVGSEDKVTSEVETRSIFAASQAPACIISYPGADHFAWTDLHSDFHPATAAAVIAFLNEVFAGHLPTESKLAAPGAEEVPECPQ